LSKTCSSRDQCTACFLIRVALKFLFLKSDMLCAYLAAEAHLMAWCFFHSLSRVTDIIAIVWKRKPDGGKKSKRACGSSVSPGVVTQKQPAERRCHWAGRLVAAAVTPSCHVGLRIEIHGLNPSVPSLNWYSTRAVDVNSLKGRRQVEFGYSTPREAIRACN